MVLAARALRDVPNGMFKRRMMMRVPTTGLFVGGYERAFIASTRFGATIHGNTRDMIQAHIFAFGQWKPTSPRGSRRA